MNYRKFLLLALFLMIILFIINSCGKSSIPIENVIANPTKFNGKRGKYKVTFDSVAVIPASVPNKLMGVCYNKQRNVEGLLAIDINNRNINELTVEITNKLRSIIGKEFVYDAKSYSSATNPGYIVLLIYEIEGIQFPLSVENKITKDIIDDYKKPMVGARLACAKMMRSQIYKTSIVYFVEESKYPPATKDLLDNIPKDLNLMPPGGIRYFEYSITKGGNDGFAAQAVPFASGRAKPNDNREKEDEILREITTLRINEQGVMTGGKYID